MKTGALKFLSAVTVLGTLTLPVNAAQKGDSDIITFDAPGADTTANDYNGTFPSSINDWGVITGSYLDANDVYHGFLRTPDGKYTGFEVPGAGTTQGSYEGTVPNSINDFGEITGYYADSNGTTHGFIRSTAGKFTSFDVPGATGSYPIALNIEGATVGYYLDSNSQFHAFLRGPNGAFTSFDGPGACESGTSSGCYGSAAFNINIFGTVAASYEDSSGNFVGHGLIRGRDGKLTAYEAPGASTGAYQGTGCPGCALGINASGAIAGIYTDSNSVYHGFLRSPEGRFTTFDAPGAGTGSQQGTGCFSDCSVSLNDFGEITGQYIDANNTVHGFLRGPGGNITTVDPPASSGTFPGSINDEGVVTGTYLDTNNVYHGFLRIPSRFR